MSLKAELETWAAALKAYDEEDFDKSLGFFFVRRTRIIVDVFLTMCYRRLLIHRRSSQILV